MQNHPQPSKGSVLRVAAVGDLHYTKHSKGKLQPLFTELSQRADVALLCGDLTDYGLLEEAHLLVDDLRGHLKIPALAVMGNHDFESNQAEEIEKLLYDVGVEVLDGETKEIQGVGFAGVCGFGGGFDSFMLNSWGEKIIKAFVQEAVDHALKLEKALARLHTERKIVLMHYAPIRATVEGEPPEIFPFLGSTRLEGPLNRFKVDAVFHGHAHNGAHAGKTGGNIPVYNVAIPVLEKQRSPHLYKLIEVPTSNPSTKSNRLQKIQPQPRNPTTRITAMKSRSQSRKRKTTSTKPRSRSNPSSASLSAAGRWDSRSPSRRYRPRSIP